MTLPSPALPSSAASSSGPLPRATYRVQLHAGFTFDDAAAIVEQLSQLGISHLYCSPILQAAPGSTHGYDVVDHGRLSDDLGGRSGYDSLCRELAAHDMALVLDIVPNHMALAGAANQWWWDVLEDGPDSRYARHFDIDWSPNVAGDSPSVLAPILGDHYGRVLEAGGLKLNRSAGSCTVTYEDHELPLSPESVGDVLAQAARRPGAEVLSPLADGLRELPASSPSEALSAEQLNQRHLRKEALRAELRSATAADPRVAEAVDTELATINSDPDALDALLNNQNYRLAHWRTASEEIDYRRFFDITTLVGLRAEDPQVFADTHRLILELVELGDVVGLRVDHVDGLRDPDGYLNRLAESAPNVLLVVEKILASGEGLPPWRVAGSTGYDFMNRLGAVFVDRSHVEEITAAYDRFVGDYHNFGDISLAAKMHVMEVELVAEVERLTHLLARLCRDHRRQRDHTHRDLRETLMELAASFDVYRTYVTPAVEPSTDDRRRILDAVGRVIDRGNVDVELAGFVGRALLLELPGDTARELAVRFQQLTAPVMAKGVEDTAFYRYNRLVSLNEVGGEPGLFGASIESFHNHNAAIAAEWPHTMLTLSTHDTKRSVDVRTRISLLSELPKAWPEALEQWSEHNGRNRTGGFDDPSLEVLLYQTLVGAWPIEPERVDAAMTKSAREAKQHTSWANIDDQFETALTDFVTAAMGDDVFIGLLESFLAHHDIVNLGRRSSLSQLAVMLTSPGFPDIYQGSELWDLSLVDPDNRRPVDFTERADLINAAARMDGDLAPDPDDDSGLVKVWLIEKLLRHRRQNPHVYDSRVYEPLGVNGAKERHAIAFTRGPLATVAPCLLIGLGGDWQDTSVVLPERSWVDLLSGAPVSGGEIAVGELFDRFPIAVLAEDSS